MQHFDVVILLFSLIIGWIATDGHKTQFVRLIDILFYGPFLIRVGMEFNNKYIRAILFLMGGTTITYNLKNYIDEHNHFNK